MNKCGYIIVEGNIGAGKSHLSKELVGAFQAKNNQAVLLAEPDETNNPFMPLYYSDPKRWAFAMQMHLLGKRYEMTQYAQHGALSGRGWFVMDRSYFGDLYFAKVQMKDGFFTPDEFRSYVSLHKAMQANIHFPTACIFLDCTPETCKRRIDKRISEKAGRACESTISMNYLESLQAEIEHLAAFMESQTKVIHLPWDEDKSDLEISMKALFLAEQLLDDTSCKTDFYHPWGACASSLFEVCNG